MELWNYRQQGCSEKRKYAITWSSLLAACFQNVGAEIRFSLVG